MLKGEKRKMFIDIQPIGRRIEIEEGVSLLGAAQSAGVGLVSLCGGEGWCLSCLVRVVEGAANPPTQYEEDFINAEDIEAGYRLACQTIPQTDMLVDIPAESLSNPQRLQVEGQEFDIPLAPIVDVIDLELTPPVLDDLRADADRLKDALADIGNDSIQIGYHVLIDLSSNLRKNKWSIRIVLRDKEVIAVMPSECKIYGVAVDIGTTKLAIYLIDLLTGEMIDKIGEMNPQISYGEDVISRIAYTNQNEEGRESLQIALVNTLNKKIKEVSKSHRIRIWQIVDTVFVGNTAMHHLFAGLPIDQLVYAPYISAVNEAMDIYAKDIGVEISPGAYVHLLPNIAGYVGSDHSAVILSTEIWKTDKTVLAIDVGTNTEITLAIKGRLLSCSCASGPAFEGAHIKDGMRAAPGAIERVQIVAGEVKTFTINNEPPVGICGSGILDVVAEMKAANIMDEKGALTEGKLNIRRDENLGLEFVLALASTTGHGRDITVTRKDVNEIQLAKAAIKAGQEILLAEAGITANEVDEVIIAGAFGTYIDVPNAIKVGMFLDIPIERFRQIGNAAGMGAAQALISFEHRELIQRVIKGVEYIELTTYKSFQKEYIKAMYLR